MTEEDGEQTLAYLRGRVEALESMLDVLIQHMPNIVIHDLRQQGRRNTAGIEQRLAADPAHRHWDMARRSWHPPDAVPVVTLHAAGMRDAYAAMEAMLDGMQIEREEGFSGNIGLSEEGMDKEQFLRDALAQEGKPYP